MELLVKNIGKISNAKIDLNGLTVITGYNGTGKSTLCRALYSMMDTFSDINQKIISQRKNSLINYIYSFQEKLMDAGFNEEDSEKVFDVCIQNIVSMKNFDENGSLEKLLEQIKEEVEMKLDSDFVKYFSEKYKEIAEKDKNDYLQFIISRNIKGIFRNQISHVNHLDKETVIELSDEQKIWTVSFIGNDLVTYDYKYNIKKPIYIEPQSVLDIFDSGNTRLLRRNSGGIQGFLIKDDMHNSKVTLEEYQEQQQNLKIINDILQDVTKGRLVSKQSHALSYIESGLDSEIVCGNIASGLKPFLIIQRMIENGALGQGRYLIIDEPEVNLHPEWQIAFAKILVLLNKELNIQVVLSTHSPYFLRALEHYMSEYENDSNGKYYITEKGGDGFYTVKDVTDNLECVYKTMYMPLEEID